MYSVDQHTSLWDVIPHWLPTGKPQSCPRNCTKTNLWNVSCSLSQAGVKAGAVWIKLVNESGVSGFVTDLSRSYRRTQTLWLHDVFGLSDLHFLHHDSSSVKNSRSTDGSGACTALLDDSSSLNIHWKWCSVSEQFRFWINKKNNNNKKNTPPCLPEAQTSRAQVLTGVRIHSWSGDFNKYQMGAATLLYCVLLMVIRTTLGPLQVQFECLYWFPPMCYFELKSPVTLFDPVQPADGLIVLFFLKGPSGPHSTVVSDCRMDCVRELRWNCTMCSDPFLEAKVLL